MTPSVTNPQDLMARITHVLLFVLGSCAKPTLDDWYRAVDDQFEDFDEAGRRRVVEAAIALMEGEAQPQKPGLLLAA